MEDKFVELDWDQFEDYIRQSYKEIAMDLIRMQDGAINEAIAMVNEITPNPYRRNLIIHELIAYRNSIN